MVPRGRRVHRWRLRENFCSNPPRLRVNLLPVLDPVEEQHPHLIRKGRSVLWRYLRHGFIVNPITTIFKQKQNGGLRFGSPRHLLIDSMNDLILLRLFLAVNRLVFELPVLPFPLLLTCS